MADELPEESELEEPLDDDELSDEEKEAIGEKSSFLKVGIPIILVQAVIAYFLASYVVVPMFISDAGAENINTEKTMTKDDSLSAIQDSIAQSYAVIGPIMNIDDIIVNPAQTDGERLVVMNMALELKEEAMLEECQKRIPLLRDITISLISALPIDSLDGAQNKARMKNDLAQEFKTVLPPGAVKRVYFTTFIIQ